MVFIGELHLEDNANPGKIVEVKAGEVVQVKQGTTAKWSTPTNCKGKFLHIWKLPIDERG